MLGDQLIGNTVQVCTDDLRLRANSQDVVARPLDQGSLPARGDGAKRVPCMASDQTELRGLNPKLPLDISISLARGLVMLHAICAKAPLEEIGNAAMFKLTGLNLKQIVCEGKQRKRLLIGVLRWAC